MPVLNSILYLSAGRSPRTRKRRSVPGSDTVTCKRSCGSVSSSCLSQSRSLQLAPRPGCSQPIGNAALPRRSLSTDELPSSPEPIPLHRRASLLAWANPTPQLDSLVSPEPIQLTATRFHRLDEQSGSRFLYLAEAYPAPPSRFPSHSLKLAPLTSPGAIRSRQSCLLHTLPLPSREQSLPQLAPFPRPEQILHFAIRLLAALRRCTR